MASKKTFIILSVAAALFLIFAVYNFINKNEAGNDQSSLIASRESGDSLIVELDLDNDGLKDWEEVLWGTKPNEADSDGDGTSDGEEVRLGRNPTKKGPNDKFDRDQNSISESLASYSTENLNPTDKIAKNLFEKYLALKQGGAELTKEEEQALIRSVISANLASSKTIKSYTLANLKIIFEDDEKALRDYANNMGNILFDPSYEKTEQELVIIERSILNNDPDELKKIDAIVRVYKKIIERSLIVSVPKSLSNKHLNLVNSMEKVAQTINNMKEIYSDPYSAITNLSDYNRSAEEFNLALRDISIFFEDSAVAPDQNSLGYAFLHIYQ